MNVYPRRPLFNRRPQSNIYRMFLWVVMMLGGIWLLREMNQGEIKPLFLPTPTPTRAQESFILEGDANFTAGKLSDAITAYREAARMDPNNAQTWAKLARIQTYSSAFLTTDAERRARLEEALQSADKAKELAPEDSMTLAIRAFALDWIANPVLIGEEQAQDYLTEAEQEALRALQLDNTNTLALAFYAEILVDQQKWTQAEQYIQQALDRDPTLMDVHRVYAYVLESLGQYNLAITEYDKAITIAPNFTFLHLRAGANYRRLAFDTGNEETYNRALEYFDKAARINEQLGVNDPVPYLSIAKTYSQMGQFFIAARNVEKALSFDPASADTYGQLAIIYFKSRNYEGSVPAFQCAIYGCDPAGSCEARGGCNEDLGEVGVQVTGLPLSPSTVVYYYTYGSVQAALSRPRDNRCPEALKVLGQVKGQFSSDRDIMGIVQAGEAICASLAERGASVSSPGNEAPTSKPGSSVVEGTAMPSP